MVMNLWPRATTSDEELFSSEIVPRHAGLFRKPVIDRQCGHQRLRPDRP